MRGYKILIVAAEFMVKSVMANFLKGWFYMAKWAELK